MLELHRGGCLSHISIAVIKCHDQGSLLKKGLNLAYGFRALELILVQ